MSLTVRFLIYTWLLSHLLLATLLLIFPTRPICLTPLGNSGTIAGLASQALIRLVWAFEGGEQTGNDAEGRWSNNSSSSHSQCQPKLVNV